MLRLKPELLDFQYMVCYIRIPCINGKERHRKQNFQSSDNTCPEVVPLDGSWNVLSSWMVLGMLFIFFWILLQEKPANHDSNTLPTLKTLKNQAFCLPQNTICNSKPTCHQNNNNNHTIAENDLLGYQSSCIPFSLFLMLKGNLRSSYLSHSFKLCTWHFPSLPFFINWCCRIWYFKFCN